MTTQAETVLALGSLVALMATLALCREVLRLAKPHRPIDFPFAVDDSECRVATGGRRRRQKRHRDGPPPIRSSVVRRASIDYPFMDMQRRE